MIKKHFINLYFYLLNNILPVITKLSDYKKESQDLCVFKNEASGSFCSWDPSKGSCKKRLATKR